MTSTQMPADITAATADQVLDRLVVARAVEPTRDPEEREQTLIELISIVESRREPLDRARAYFQQRLSRRSDDFEATHGLQMVEGALVLIAHSETRAPSPTRRRRRSTRLRQR